MVHKGYMLMSHKKPRKSETLVKFSKPEITIYKNLSFYNIFYWGFEKCVIQKFDVFFYKRELKNQQNRFMKQTFVY